MEGQSPDHPTQMRDRFSDFQSGCWRGAFDPHRQVRCASQISFPCPQGKSFPLFCRAKLSLSLKLGCATRQLHAGCSNCTFKVRDSSCYWLDASNPCLSIGTENTPSGPAGLGHLNRGFVAETSIRNSTGMQAALPTNTTFILQRWEFKDASPACFRFHLHTPSLLDSVAPAF
ncbi:hypothetical protein BJ508DRAFT_119204 [Ascobolus immersus RN42]|uniref:Uncharacterized protein n=1 Tax=Ascobolus immersus RN42 TaxID=1160509 RepID=A0A3N4IR37_ASCIM|nr:hypothetical protein BJ508DRAFT_119204 [Ascobolus immersus RN42]